MPSLEQLSAQLDRLANWDAGPFPVVSLYLNLQPDDRGRDRFAAFLRKELDERIASYAGQRPEHESLLKDAEKIRQYAENLDPSANGLALFSSSGSDLFEAMPLTAPIPEHLLYVSRAPHLYPLARLLDEYPRYAALLADTQSARIFVFAVNALERETTVVGVKTKHHKKGGWSQARYQRHAESYHLHHAKEIVDALARIVRDEHIASVIVAGDEVILPLLREQMPKDLADRVVEAATLDVRTPDREVLDATLAVMKEKDAESDRERVEALLDAYRSNGLAVVGVEGVRKALELGQVDELVIAARPEAMAVEGDELVANARQTSAKIRFIEDAALLSTAGGVGAFLRFKP